MRSIFNVIHSHILEECKKLHKLLGSLNILKIIPARSARINIYIN